MFLDSEKSVNESEVKSTPPHLHSVFVLTRRQARRDPRLGHLIQLHGFGQRWRDGGGGFKVRTTSNTLRSGRVPSHPPNKSR